MLEFHCHIIALFFFFIFTQLMKLDLADNHVIFSA